MDNIYDDFITELLLNIIFFIKENINDDYKIELINNIFYNEFVKLICKLDNEEKNIIINLIIEHLDYELEYPSSDFVIFFTELLINELDVVFESLKRDDEFYEHPYALHKYIKNSYSRTISLCLEFQSDYDFNIFNNIDVGYIEYVIRNRYEILCLDNFNDLSIGDY